MCEDFEATLERARAEDARLDELRAAGVIASKGMGYGDGQVGDIVIDTYGQRWEVIEIVQHAHLRAVNPDDPSPYRFIRAINWPEYRGWEKA